MLVVAVCSLKGGVGKTSVTLGLASAAMAADVPVLVVDLDPQADATTGLDVVTAERHVGDVLGRPKRKVVESAVVPSGWTPDSPGRVDVLSGSWDSAAHDVPSPTREEVTALAHALGKLPQPYDLVLVDCPPNLGALTRSGLTAADRALVVCEPGLFSVTAADRALRAVHQVRSEHAPQLQPLGVVVNRVRSRSLEHAHRIAEIRELFGPLVLTPELPERSALQQAQGAGRPLHDWPTPSARELAADFDGLLARVLRAGRMRRRKR